ncbi:MAG: phosphonate ABC transporter ATP-binding protein [Flavobacteriales bacterium]|nr:phosphonate ABC transporter ATP-binding protein [Flavobacteriales bacterium]
MIIIKNLNIYQENHQIFDNVSLKISNGEFVYLIGDTGSGKSSLLKSLYAEIKPESGSIKVGEFEIQSLKDKDIPFLRREVGIVFQDFQLLTDRNIYNNLKFVLKATGWKDKIKINNRIKEVLNAVHLDSMEEKMPYELSGGEQQKAAIARALLNKPKIILADEPTGNLDPEKSIKIIQLLEEINLSGTTIIIATHDYEIMRKVKKRTVKCNDKKIVEIDPESL